MVVNCLETSSLCKPTYLIEFRTAGWINWGHCLEVHCCAKNWLWQKPTCMKLMLTQSGVRQMWTTTAAPQYGSTTAWWTSHRRQALTTSVQSRGQTNTAVEHMQSWKGCICMVQIPLTGKYTSVFKEKRNKPTHVAHLNFKVFFCCWGCLPCWSSGLKHHPLASTRN